jgi:ABC-type uncharacterized transport system auxiliary subunit
LSQPFPDRATYALEPGKPEKAASGSELTVRVMPVRVAKPYDSQLFTYKVGASQFTQDYYAGFIAPPDRLLSADLVDWVSDSGAVKYAVGVGSTLECAANLESQVTAMYADYTNNTAVLEMRVFLITEASGHKAARVLFQKSYAEKEPLSAKTPAAFVTALNGAWRRALVQVAEDLRGQKAPAAATEPMER